MESSRHPFCITHQPYTHRKTRAVLCTPKAAGQRMQKWAKGRTEWAEPLMDYARWCNPWVIQPADFFTQTKNFHIIMSCNYWALRKKLICFKTTLFILYVKNSNYSTQELFYAPTVLYSSGFSFFFSRNSLTLPLFWNVAYSQEEWWGKILKRKNSG